MYVTVENIILNYYIVHLSVYEIVIKMSPSTIKLPFILLI